MSLPEAIAIIEYIIESSKTQSSVNVKTKTRIEALSTVIEAAKVGGVK